MDPPLFLRLTDHDVLDDQFIEWLAGVNQVEILLTHGRHDDQRPIFGANFNHSSGKYELRLTGQRVESVDFPTFSNVDHVHEARLLEADLHPELIAHIEYFLRANGILARRHKVLHRGKSGSRLGGADTLGPRGAGSGGDNHQVEQERDEEEKHITPTPVRVEEDTI